MSTLALAPQQLGTFETLHVNSGNNDKTATATSTARVVRLESWLGKNPVSYQQGLERQVELWQAHADRLKSTLSRKLNECDEGNGGNEGNDDDASPPSSFWKPPYDRNNGVDTILMLEHSPVYTLGTASDVQFLHDTINPAVPIHRISRGGEVTYHGPGQLTIYPVLDLRSYRQDIHWYMRALEEAIILALADLGIQANRDEETTGVWVDNHKVAAVGIHARRWITQHGLALNVEEKSLDGFADIVPCGLEDRKVGCVNQFLQRPISVPKMAQILQASLEEVFRIQLQT